MDCTPWGFICPTSCCECLSRPATSDVPGDPPMTTTSMPGAVGGHLSSPLLQWLCYHLVEGLWCHCRWCCGWHPLSSVLFIVTISSLIREAIAGMALDVIALSHVYKPCCLDLLMKLSFVFQSPCLLQPRCRDAIFLGWPCVAKPVALTLATPHCSGFWSPISSEPDVLMPDFPAEGGGRCNQ